MAGIAGREQAAFGGRKREGFGRAGLVPLLHLIHAFFHIGELLLNLLQAVGFSGCAALAGIGEKFVADEDDTDDGDRNNYQTEGARLLRRRYTMRISSGTSSTRTQALSAR